ncbi:DUF167 domain-containing protein, partial [candidate division WWE3 bacterium]|nr:DUF167 domain-containing protein [candidate division WWE3 bacterium]
EPAKENKANYAIIKIVAQHYKVPKTSVKLLSGEKNKNKILSIAV